MGLDPALASQLLKGLPHDEVQELVLEMAQIETSAPRDKKNELKIVREFTNTVQKGQTAGLSVRTLINETLKNVVGKEQAEQIQAQVSELTDKKDPFEPIRIAKVDELALALKDESPGTIALIMGELQPKKIREILASLDREVCHKTVFNMTKPKQLSKRVKNRIANVITDRLRSFKGETIAEKPKEILRNVAIVLSDTEQNLRTEILEEIGSHDEDTAKAVRNLMITWEDITTIADRSLQEALRTIDSKKLSIALFQADEEIANKIRSNISERLAASIDEEMMLMQEPLEEEVLDAREEVVEPLRKANEEGTLRRTKAR